MKQFLATTVPGLGLAITSGVPVSAGSDCGWAARAALATCTEVARAGRADQVPPAQPVQGRSSE